MPPRLRWPPGQAPGLEAKANVDIRRATKAQPPLYRFERFLSDEDKEEESRLECHDITGEVSPLFAWRGKGVTRCVRSDLFPCYQCDCFDHENGADPNALGCALNELLENKKTVLWPGHA